MTSFDRIFASAPSNRTAAAVTGRGEHYEPAKRITGARWDAPPPMKPVPVNSIDLVGRRKGRLTVIGLFDDPDRSRRSPAAWVVRCVCGAYETRRAKVICDPANPSDRCQHCENLRHIVERQKTLGSKSIEAFTTKGRPA